MNRSPSWLTTTETPWECCEKTKGSLLVEGWMSWTRTCAAPPWIRNISHCWRCNILLRSPRICHMWIGSDMSEVCPRLLSHVLCQLEKILQPHRTWNTIFSEDPLQFPPSPQRCGFSFPSAVSRLFASVRWEADCHPSSTAAAIIHSKHSEKRRLCHAPHPLQGVSLP